MSKRSRYLGFALMLAAAAAFLTGPVTADEPAPADDVIPGTVPAAVQAKWEKENPGSLPIWLTPEELKLLPLIGKGFMPTTPPVGSPRQVAEFEPMESVLIRYPFGIGYPIIKEMAEDCHVVTIVSSASNQSYVTNKYQQNGVDLNHCSFLIAASDSYWTRDYGPWSLFDGNDLAGIVDMVYNRPGPTTTRSPRSSARTRTSRSTPWTSSTRGATTCATAGASRPPRR